MLDSTGHMYIEEDDIIELMLQNRQAKILPKDNAAFMRFANECKMYNISIPFRVDTARNTMEWNIPDEYKNLDIRDYIRRSKRLNTLQWSRVDYELSEFESRGLVDLLRFMVYMVNVIKSNNVIYGVGRGSSISSYVLFLLGVHRIDSLQYNLDIKEFLK